MVDWPEPGDKLFSSGTVWEAEALLGNPYNWILAYARSYKVSADAVIDSVEEGQVSADAVGYAVVYLYRHYVELMLKGLIKLAKTLEYQKADLPKHHRIDDLWRECRPLLEKAFPEGEGADTDAVEQCLKELDSIDHFGEALRYGEHIDGKPTLKARIQFNLLNTRKVMERLSGFLEGSYDAMDELRQCGDSE